jgi:hypothetical protein
MKIDEILTTDYLLKWIESQKYQYQEWYSQGIEVVSIDELAKQSAVLTSSLLGFLSNRKYEFQDYTYSFDSSFNRIVRTSPKIKKPSESKPSYTIRRIKEVLQ